jgi:hypothetical protein
LARAEESAGRFDQWALIAAGCRRQTRAALNAPGAIGNIEVMPRLLTADDIIPLVASLTDTERIRLLRWIASPHGTDASGYAAAPPTSDEFSGDDNPIAWEPDGWEEFH